MASLSSLLAVLEADPDDPQARDALPGASLRVAPDERRAHFSVARKALAARGRHDVVAMLLDAELAAVAADGADATRQAELWVEKGAVLDGELLDVAAARAAYQQALTLRSDDPTAREALAELDLAAANWQKFADKYIKEAAGSTDRGLATSLYVSAAEAFVRFAPTSTESEQFLTKALEVDPRNARAAFHLGRLYRREARWADLARLLESRADVAPSVEEKVSSLIGLAWLSRTHLGTPDRAEGAMKRVLVLDAAQPQALRAVTDAAVARQDWPAVVQAYQAALKARRDDDLGMLLQVAMVLWRHLGDLDRAETFFARIRKIDPAHPAALDFYRAYYPLKGENQKLLALLRQAEKVARPRTESGPQARAIAMEIAELAEAQNNPEKAIEAWKQQLRQDPHSTEARQALARLYRRTEKWNALLDLMKEDIERLPESDVAGRVERLHDIVEIYRDKLRLDVMVINTYHAILKLDPDNGRATDELAAKFRALGRWNDLIAVLTRKSESPAVPDAEKIQILREIAELWSDRFGNFANAVKPLERILELTPGEYATVSKLKEIYTKRRQWRALIELLGREAAVLPAEDKRAKQMEMARLAAERVGDARLAIEILNQMLAEGGDHPEVLATLVGLYEREKRYLPLAEILHRQRRASSGKEAVALLEKLGQLYHDRLGSPAVAATVWQEVLELEPNHGKALRTLRELYATAGDFAGLERLYERLGQSGELVEALLGIADRLDDRARRLPLLERAAQLAQEAADRDPSLIERARQLWERVLAVEPTHVGAAHSLAPIYERQEKWARLIAVLEIALAAAKDVPARMARIAEIRRLCEQRLASRSLAFAWTMRAFDLDPTDRALLLDLFRLAAEPDQWRDLAATLDRHLDTGRLAPELRLEVLRELAKIATRRLADPDRARGYHRQVLALAPDDREAEQHVEELSIQLADWPELLASYRRRADREDDPEDKAALLNEIASLQEEKLVDLDAAAATYREALAVLPGQLRAMRALARIDEARGDFDSLASVLSMELERAPDGQARFDLLLRLGQLHEQTLDRPSLALGYYRDALAIPAPGGAVRPQAVGALIRFLPVDGLGGQVSADERVGVARLLVRPLEQARNVGLLAVALEVIRSAETTPADERIELDRRLMQLYHGDLGDPAAAWSTGLRVLAADPRDRANRNALALLAGQLGRDGEWAHHLGGALTFLRSSGAVDARHVREVATELAVLALDRLGDQGTAERAWMIVLEVEPAASDAFDMLESLFRTQQRWSDLRALLGRRVDISAEPRARITALLDAASLEEGQLAQPGAAAASHRRVLEIEPGFLASYQALDRLYTAAEQWTELEALLGRQLAHVPDRGVVSGGEHVALQFRRAELLARRLGDPTRALDLLEDVLARDRDHEGARELLRELMAGGAQDVQLRAARALEPLHEHDRNWKALVETLRVRRAHATGTEAVELFSRIAAIHEGELAAPGAAFDAWIEVLRLDPTHERARVELARLAQQLQRWPEATSALEGAAGAAPEGDVVTRAALYGELAAYYDTQLGDRERAIAAYQRWLDVDGTNPTTIRRATSALARLHEAEQNWPALRAIVRKQAEWAEEPSGRLALLGRVALLDEQRLADRPAAIATWREVLSDTPTDTPALAALERLYEQDGAWEDLVEVLRRKHDQASPIEARELLLRIAELHEQRLADPEEAIGAYLEVLDRDGADARALGELARLYRSAERHADLLDVIDRQAASDPVRRPALLVDSARLLAGPLARPVEALERWRAVLSHDQQHAEALEALEGALGDPDLRIIAVDILRPVYEASGQYERLSNLYERSVEWTDDVGAKLGALADVVRLREHRLGDKPGAFSAAVLALRNAATEPELAEVLADVDRLAGELGREAELIDVYREVAPSVLDSEIQRRLHLDIADLARGVRRDHDLAREYYQKVLDAQSDDRRALTALEAIYRETGRREELTEILIHQAESPTADIDERVASLAEAASLYLELDRPEDAIGAWEQVLAIAPERRDAASALDELYRRQGRWPDVVDLYERRLGIATSVEEAVNLRVQLGEIHEKHLHDIEGAIDNYAAALGGDPRNALAISAVERFLLDPELRAMAAEVLEPIYVGQQRWTDLVRVHEARLDSAVDPRERIRITRFVARLYEEQLEDFESAARWYARLFRESPGDQAVRDQLQRLASIVENWEFVAQTYLAFLDEEQGETSEVRDIAVSVAAILDRRLGRHDEALRIYRRALAIEPEGAQPSERELIRRLEEMLARTQRWADLVAVYDDVLTRADDELRREASIKRARMLEDPLGDMPRAIEGWREVMSSTEHGGTPIVEHAYREAVTELDRLFREGRRWTDLVDLFEARLTRSQDPGEVAELRLGLADVLELEVQDRTAAIDQLEHVLAEGRKWERAVYSLERLVVHEAHRQRITELLEPVYREQDWWQKLVVILDAKLDFVEDAVEQISILQEIAGIHERRGGALDLALEALARAWRIDVAEDESLLRFLGLASKLGAWSEAAATIEEGAAAAPNQDLAAGLWARVAEIHEVHLGDRGNAIRAWRMVEESRPDDVVALAALDRLLAIERLNDELVGVVEKRAELTEDGSVRLVLLHRVATLYDEVLRQRPKAVATYRKILDLDDTDMPALDALERLYRTSLTEQPGPTNPDARELAGILERRIELAVDVEQRRALRHLTAVVYERDLQDAYQAIAQLTAILEDDAGELQALAELDRLYLVQKMWPELLDVVDRRALLASHAQDRADLAYRGAHLVQVELSDAEAAIPRYGAVLQMLPTHQAARAALEALLLEDDHVASVSPILERLYRAERDAPGLVRVYERRLSVLADDPEARRSDWNALAGVHESLADDRVAAFRARARAITELPEDADLLAPLQRLAETEAALWPELAEVLDRLLASTLPPDVEQAYAMRLGQIAEDRLSDLPRAAAAFERASHGIEPRSALAALERVLARSGRWPDVAFVIRREAEVADDDPQRAEYLYRAGDLAETTLRDEAGAVAAYREVLQLVPTHAQARQSLERMVTTAPDQRAAIVEVLEPLFDQDGDAARLVMILEVRLGLTTDPLDRASILSRVAELTEHRLGDRNRALDAALRWLAIEPSSSQALVEVERLADRLGQWSEVGSRLETIVRAPDASTRDRDTQVALHVFLGKIQRVRLGQLDAAAASYQAALELEPESVAALDELITILRQKGDQLALADALRRRGRTASEAADRRAAFAEVASICERAGDRAGATVAWREISDHDDTDRGALDELARLYRATVQRTELVETLHQAARLATSAEDEKSIRVEIAQLETDGARAVSAWQAVLDLDGDDVAALTALQGAHAKAGDWMSVVDVQSRRLALAVTTGDKVAIHAEMARTAEERRGSTDDAIASWYAALDVDPSYTPAYEHLDRLLTQAQRPHDLVDLLSKRAELYAAQGDTSAELAVLARAADVWEGQLDNADAAGEILEKILQREPSSVAALTRLSKIYERAGNWDDCKRTLEQALRVVSSSSHGPGRDGADLFFRLGEVARTGDGDVDTAVLHYQQALRHDAAHLPAIGALEAIARDRRDHALLGDLLTKRVAVVATAAERVALLVELAELERKAGRLDAALAALVRANQDSPDDARVLAPLADLYFAVNRLDEAAPIYDRLAGEAKVARRMKDVARFRQRQGGILEARGDRPGALAAYEEALRVNPTDVSTMTGLGRLYLASEDWEKARKIYQSLVLQNIDPDAGVTKAEVYWALGKIHLQLGQPPKAKSMFQRGLEIEPHNQKLKDALTSLG